MLVLSNSIDRVRNEQDELMKLDTLVNTLEVSPAFQWAQDLNSVALSVKLANRLDSPSCIDFFDETVEISHQAISVKANCDKKEVKINFVLDIDLFEEIDPDESRFEYQSTGRIYLNLTKAEQPKRW